MKWFDCKRLICALVQGALVTGSLTPVPSLADPSRFFHIHARVSGAMGGQGTVNQILIDDAAGLLIWYAPLNAKIMVLPETGASKSCRVDRADIVVVGAIRAELGRLKGPTLLSSKTYFPSGHFVSAPLTETFRAFGKSIPTGCLIDMYDAKGGLLAVRVDKVAASAAAPLTLALNGGSMPVRLGLRSWLYNPANRDKLVTAIAAHKPQRLLSFGDAGMVGISATAAPFLVVWDRMRRVDLLPWASAQPIVRSEAAALFSDSGTASMADEAAYFDLLATLARGSDAWRSLSRQSPSITFRRW